MHGALANEKNHKKYQILDFNPPKISPQFLKLRYIYFYNPLSPKLSPNVNILGYTNFSWLYPPWKMKMTLKNIKFLLLYPPKLPQNLETELFIPFL